MKALSPFPVQDHILGNSVYPDLTSTEVLVALTLLKHRYSKKLFCTPTQHQLATETRLSERTIRTSLDALENKGRIIRIRSKKTHYFFTEDLVQANQVATHNKLKYRELLLAMNELPKSMANRKQLPLANRKLFPVEPETVAASYI